mmetsp:Transcript_12846/g.41998  ORF Transcript_12846/g.41998 Transcript_12846/m.41998 type:complete len:80 (-) Transcript_12846:625-864(-)
MSAPLSVGDTRKHLFRKSMDGNHADTHEKDFTDFEDKPTASQRAEMADILTQLREEVKNIDETNWLYEGGETHIVKLRL